MKPFTTPIEVSKEFVPFAVNLFTNDFLLDKLDQSTLASWLKTMVVVFFKHHVGNEKLVREVFRRVLSVFSLTKEIQSDDSLLSDECKQLVIACCSALLRRDPVLCLSLLPVIFPRIGSLVTPESIQKRQPTTLHGKTTSFHLYLSRGCSNHAQTLPPTSHRFLCRGHYEVSWNPWLLSPPVQICYPGWN